MLPADQLGDLGLAVNADPARLDLLGFVRQNYLVGDTLTVNELRGGKPAAVKLILK